MLNHLGCPTIQVANIVNYNYHPIGDGNNLLSSGLSSGLSLLAALITLELLKTETETISLLLKSIYLT